MQHTPSQRPPLITIGVPTYNGGKYLRGCLTNILEQTYHDYNVVISDNGSTDTTAEIAKEFVEKDSRFRYIKQPSTLEAALHFPMLLDYATAPLFIWHSDDDVWQDNYLETLVRLLETHPGSQLAVADYVIEYMDNTHRRETQAYEAFGPSVFERMRELSQFPAGWIYGLYRRESLTAIAKVIRERFQLTRGWDLLVLFYYGFNNLVVGSSDTSFTWRCYIDQGLGRDLAGGNTAPPGSAHPSKVGIKTVFQKIRFEIVHSKTKTAKKIAKVDYLIDARRRFLAIASEWIQQSSYNPAQKLMWHLYLWHFVAKRVYPARKAIKYRIMRTVSGMIKGR